jgi:predicted outer membrane repeat protein
MSTRRLMALVAVWAVVLMARSALSQVVYVDAAAVPGGNGSSWGSAYNDLQAGLAAARSNLTVREVRVAQGVYRPGSSGGGRGVSFALVERVALRGGYAGGASVTPDARDVRGTPSVLSGDLAGNDVAGDGRGVRTDNAFHVVTAVALAYPAVIDGFHITGGRADGTGDGETQGGGLYVDQCGSNLVVSRCVIRDNDATVGAGAVVLDSQAVLTQCVIVGNRAFGWPGLLVYGMRLPLVPTIDHCTIVYNTGSSGSAAGIRAIASMPDPDPEAAPGSTVMLKTPVRSSIVAFNDRGVETYMPLQVSGFTDAVSCASMNTEGWDQDLNVFGEPLFADAAGPDGVVGTLDDDLRLRPLSLGIDGGGSAGVDVGDIDGDGDTSEAAPVDVDGSIRVYGMSSDIGASEGPVLTVVTSPEPVSVSEGGSVTFTVRFTRDPGTSIRVSMEAAVAGGTAPAAMPAFVDLDSTNWEAGVAVSVAWPTDAGLTDDTTPMVFTGAGIATAEQTFTQVDGTTPPGVLYVNPGGTLPPDGASWASGYRTIEAALDVAAAFPTIEAVWVKTGMYRPPLPVGVTDGSQRVYVVRPGLKVIGGFSGTETSPSQRSEPLNHSVINGDLAGNDGPEFSFYGDNITTVFRINNATEGTELDGFHLTHAQGPAVSANAGAAGDRLNVRNCRFTYNQGTSLLKGGGIGVSGVYDCVFEDTGSLFSSSAWALRISGESGSPLEGVIEVHRCVFRRIGGGNGTGGFHFGGRKLDLSGCQFSNVGGHGGTAWVELYGLAETGVFASVTGCTFENNNSGLTIRANQQWMATVLTSRVVDSTFRNTGFGLNPTPVSEVIGCLFENNLGGGGTGKGYRNCTFRGNRAARGGAGPSGAEGCLFEDNVATISGGASETGTFVRCTFRNNRAPNGGALSGATLIDSCVFEGNRATAGSSGAIGGAALAISCTFIGNSATEDGGAGTVASAVACSFFGNTSGGRGGALYSPTQVVNSVFTGNSAGGSGGAVYRVYRMLGCTVYGNHASAAGGVDMPQAGFEPSTIANSILWGNTAATGSTEEKQVRAAVRTSHPDVFVQSGWPTGAQNVWASASMVTGPMSGGFTPAQIQAVLAAPFGPPYTYPYSCAAPVGGVNAIMPAWNPVETWVSVLPSTGDAMPSVLMRLATAGAPPAVAFSRAEWQFSFVSDGTVGDNDNPGLYIGSSPIVGTTGGSAGEQTDWVLDISDLVEPRVARPQFIYLRNDDGFAGLMFRSRMVYYTPAVSHSIVQGLSVHAGEGNMASDPQLAAIAGPDEVLGTVDDDPTPLLTSPIVDSGNSRMIGVDEADVDRDLDTAEPILTDLLGNPRVVDCPVSNTSVGIRGPVDRGAVEVPPFQMLMAPPCAADIGKAGGVYGRDGVLDNNDFIAFIDAFFLFSLVADVGSAGGLPGADGHLDNNDFIVFINRFFEGC